MKRTFLALGGLAAILGLIALMQLRPQPGQLDQSAARTTDQGLPLALPVQAPAPVLLTGGLKPLLPVSAEEAENSEPRKWDDAPAVLERLGIHFQQMNVVDFQEVALAEPGLVHRAWLLQADFAAPWVRVDAQVRAEAGSAGETLLAAQAAAADHVLVTVAEGVRVGDALAALGQLGFSDLKTLGDSDSILIQLERPDLDALPAAQVLLSQLGTLIVAAEPDGIGTAAALPDDPQFVNQWNLQNTGQSGGTAGADVSAPAAWDRTASLSDVPPVAVLDTGLDVDQPDLAGRIWTNNGEVPFNDIDDDGNGYVDDYEGYDLVRLVQIMTDDNGHGTRVAGVLAANRDNALGIAGVSSQTQVLPVKVLDHNGNGLTSNVVNGLSYARQRGARIANLSLHNFPNNLGISAEITRWQNAGGLVVISAGNDGTNNDVTPNYPSSHTQPNIIAVGNSDRNDAPWMGTSPSNFGAVSVDIFAPGTEIWGTEMGTGYSTYTGTSMSAPHVSAAAAMIWAVNPNWTWQQVKNAILDSADAKPALSGKCLTGGRLNLDALIDESPPEITVETSTATAVNDGATRNLGSVVLGSPISEDLTIRNDGIGVLRGLAFTLSGTQSADFQTSALSQTELDPGESLTFTVTFTPSVGGTRSALLRIANNDTNENPYDIRLTGVGIVAPAITRHPVAALAVNPGATARLTVAATGTAPLTYSWEVFNSGTSMWDPVPGATSSTSLYLRSVTEASEGSYRVTVSNPAGSVSSDPCVLTVNNPVVLTSQPVALSVQEGDSATFSVAVDPNSTTPVTYQWTRNNRAISGARSEMLTLAPVKVTQAGDYRCIVRNVTGSVVSSPARLTVARDTAAVVILPLNTRSKVFAAVIGGADTSTIYDWQKDGGAIAVDANHIPSGTRLTLRALQFSDAGNYQCNITTPAGNLVAGVTQLIIYDSPPQLDSGVVAPVVLPPAQVAETYDRFAIPSVLDADPRFTPTSYSVRGLPSGLRCDKTTGAIYGKPSVVLTAVRTYNLTLYARNAKGTLAIPATLDLNPLPTDTAGDYVGIIARNDVLNASQGGLLTLRVTGTGAFSGRAVLGTSAVTVRGVVESTLGATSSTGSAFIRRRAPLANLTFNFELDPTTNRIVNASFVVEDGSALTIPVEGWRRVWSTTNLATAYVGVQTLSFTAASAADVPEGAGYASISVPRATNGTASIRGVMADGVAFATTSFIGPLGEVAVFTSRARLSSVVGYVTSQPNTSAPGNGSDLEVVSTGTLDWRREMRPATERVYEVGFGLAGAIPLEALGGRYTAPTSGQIVLGLTDDGSSANAQIAFTGGGISSGPAPSPDAELRIASLATVRYPSPLARPLSLAINYRTGLFRGSFTLIDPDLLVAGRNVKRVSKFAGMIHPDVDGLRGWGYFLLAERPDVAGETISNTNILSGLAILEPKP
ncbi:MAG: S8 family serine peptidase [Verrucomicrobiales bacterium]|nr:S8 family serine peptidase [Verrucomicrobiales bacterium]